MKLFMERHAIPRIFFIDSDVMLYANVTELAAMHFQNVPLALGYRFPRYAAQCLLASFHSPEALSAFGRVWLAEGRSSTPLLSSSAALRFHIPNPRLGSCSGLLAWFPGHCSSLLQYCVHSSLVSFLWPPFMCPLGSLQYRARATWRLYLRPPTSPSGRTTPSWTSSPFLRLLPGQ